MEMGSENFKNLQSAPPTIRYQRAAVRQYLKVILGKNDACCIS